MSVSLAAETLPTPRDTGKTGIRKHPVAWPAPVWDPGPTRRGHPRPDGLAGDIACAAGHHGGTDQAVCAYAREDWRERELGYERPAGRSAENLTTAGLDLTGTLAGERWRIGGSAVLRATSPRIPCATFAHRMGEPKWVRRFTARGATRTCLRVVTPGQIRAGDRIEVIRRPWHTVTIGRSFRALTTEPELRPGLLQAGDDLPPQERAAVLRRTT